MNGIVKIIESPRDAWQSLPKVMKPEVKAEYLRALIAAGFTHIDAVSFVSKEAFPQMADSELVLEYLDAPEGVEMIGLVANAKGAERAVKSGRVTTIAFPYSISPQFLGPEPAADSGGGAGPVGADWGAGVQGRAGCGGVCGDGVWESVWRRLGHR